MPVTAQGPVKIGRTEQRDTTARPATAALPHSKRRSGLSPRLSMRYSTGISCPLRDVSLVRTVAMSPSIVSPA